MAVWLSWLSSTHPKATIVVVVLLVSLAAFLLYHLFRFARRALLKVLT